MVYYSALHYAAKAAKSAEAAADSATQASEASGKIIQVGFDGTLANGVLTFKHAPGGVEVPYNLQDDFEYELDLAFSSTATLPTNTEMVIKNGNDTIRFVSALHREATTNATVADMDAVMRFNSSTGYRWLFKAAYKVTPSGAKVFLLYPVVAKEDTTKITNCITEIPQDIKLELNNGTLTLKAGSKVYVPNGAGKFNEVVFEEDIIFNGQTATGAKALFANADGVGLNFVDVSNTFSGSSWTPKTYSVWYDTNANLCKLFTSNSSTPAKNTSLPICIITLSNGTVTSIDQVFNGFGYIGSTVYALPGVKGLIPNGRNADGSLKNIEVTTSQVVTNTHTTTLKNFYFCIGASGDIGVGLNEYLPVENRLRNVGQTTYISYYQAGGVTFESGVITSFTPKLPFRAVDYSDSSWVAEQAMPGEKYIDLTFGASGTVYTAPANGYFRFLHASKGTAKLTYLTAGITETGVTARDTSYLANATAGYSNQVFIMAKKGQHVVIGYDAAATVTNSLARFVYCEGE